MLCDDSGDGLETRSVKRGQISLHIKIVTVSPPLLALKVQEYLHPSPQANAPNEEPKPQARIQVARQCGGPSVSKSSVILGRHS